MANRGRAVCAGYALGILERGTRRQRNGVYPYYPAGANASPVMPDTSQKDKRTNHTGIYDYYPEPSSAHQQQGKRKTEASGTHSLRNSARRRRRPNRCSFSWDEV